MKTKSLMGRWFGCKADGAAAANDGDGSGHIMQLRRDILFRHTAPGRQPVVYRIICVYTKYGKKWLPIDTAPASKDTIVHAQRLHCDSFGSSPRYNLPEYGAGADAVHPFFMALKGNEIRDFIGMLSLQHVLSSSSSSSA